MTSPMAISWSPPSCMARSPQVIQATAPSISGTPSRSACETSRNFSACGALEAKPRASSSWSAASTLIPKAPASRTRPSVRDPRSRQASISGGSSDSEATAFAVAPAGPRPVAVTIVTAGRQPRHRAAELVGGRHGHRGRKSMMPPVLRTLWLPTAAIAAALALGACGTEGIQVADDDPDLRGRRPLRRALLGLSHHEGGRGRRVRRTARCATRGRTSTSAPRPPRTSSTRFETAASRARSCPRTSSSATRPPRLPSSSPSTPAPRSTARHSEPGPERLRLRLPLGSRACSTCAPFARTRRRPELRLRGAARPRRSTSCSSSTPAAASCCPRSRGAARARTGPPTRSPTRSAPAPTPPS